MFWVYAGWKSCCWQRVEMHALLMFKSYFGLSFPVLQHLRRRIITFACEADSLMGRIEKQSVYSSEFSVQDG